MKKWASEQRKGSVGNSFFFFDGLQVEIVGQLSGQMAELVGGVVETVGEEPESEGLPEHHEEEEEERTKVALSFHFCWIKSQQIYEFSKT